MLHRLPPELLLYIIQDVSDTTTLLALALTHRSFRAIVRERLLLNARVPLRSIPHFIVLISRHPQWAESIKIIELRDDTSEYKSIPYSVPAMGVCRELISAIKQGSAKAVFGYALQLYHASPIVWTAMLFLALPCARALRVKPRSDDMPVAYEFVLRHYTRGSSQTDPLSRLELFVMKRVLVLDVHAPPELHDPIAVSHLPNLHTLAVDGQCLRPRTLRGIGTHQATVLAATRPPGSIPVLLKTLLVRADVENMPWDWLQELQWHQMRDQSERRVFTNLEVQLFSSTPYQAVEKCVSQRPKLGMFGEANADLVLSAWMIMGANFQTFFRVEDGGATGGQVENYERRVFGWGVRL